ncbi:unnamed protein product [Discula destructiva]
MGSTGLDSALDTQGLADDQRGLLDLIDKLQFAQLDNVKLPQICVVGDQSAGKSSVLEAITGTPFPRDAGACTRFATEIRLRRAAETSLKVSIIPDKHRDLKAQETLRSFGGSVDQNMSFEQLMRYAVELIAPKNIPGRFAARDILVVEKRGPDLPLLTLVDLPGLVRNANNDQSLDDIKTIESLCDHYMKSKRTIVLAVVGGNSDYVQAPILTKARAFDPSGSRTIGVLTKPDLCESIGLEDKFIDLVNNKDKANVFKLGWYVLLNPSPRDSGQSWPTASERKQKEEDFFGRGKWRSLTPDMCGAEALKAKLSAQLQRHIGRHVKTLRRQIQTALDETDGELKSMGEGKDTPEEMRIELVELFSASKELVIPAVYGFYKNPPGKKFFRMTADPRGTPAQNLRARAAEENDSFSHRIRQHGRKFGFSSNSDGIGDSAAADAASAVEAQKQTYVRQEVQTLLTQIRGSEFPGDAKPRAVYMLFQSYSEYWPKLAQEHKDNLGVVCNEFLSELIAYAWPKRMHEPLRREFLDPQMRALLDKAQAELDLLTNDMHLEVQPYDPEYEEKLRRWQRSASADGNTYSEAQEVLEKMLIYYDLTAKSFIRNVIMQVVERHLLLGMYSIFESVKCLSMTVDTIEAIAAENKETRERRILLKQRKRAIEDAKDTCASLAMRKELRVYANEAVSEGEDTSDDDDYGDGTAPPLNRTASSRAAAPTLRRRREAPQPPPAATTNGYNTTANGNGNGNGNRPASPPARTKTSQYQPPAADEEYYAPPRTSPPRATAPAIPSAAPPPPPPRPEKVQHDENGYYAPSPSHENGRPSLEEYGSFNSQHRQGGERRGQIRKILGRV